MANVPRVRRRRELAKAIAAASRGAESWLEQRSLEQVFNTSEFSRWLRQHDIRAGGQRFRLDMFDPVTCTAVELDGAAFHGEPAQRLRDVRRDTELARLGIVTLRLAYSDVVQRPEWCREVVRDAVAARERP